jgi:hypothetical protein
VTTRGAQARLLARLAPDSECFGVIGAGHPGSFYRVHVRIGSRWFSFEHDVAPCPRPVPREAPTWRGPLRDLADFAVHPERAALIALWATSRDLAEAA